jgi:NAD(P)H-hydrate epimerase
MRLVGKFNNDFSKISILQEFSKKYKVNVVLKGANSAVSDANGRVTFNTSGNQGMATAGSGDVLTGIVAGMLAQGYSDSESAKLGVFLHGLAGDFAASEQGYQALIASDIIDHLGEAFLEMGN